LTSTLDTVHADDDKILPFGQWSRSAEALWSATRFHSCEFSFRGSTIRWVGPTDDAQGRTDVFLDGELQATVDGWSDAPESEVVRFERSGLRDDRIHTIRIVVRPDRHPRAVGSRTTVASFEAESPVSYPDELKRLKDEEYELIRRGLKPVSPESEWVPIAAKAGFPQGGVSLGAGTYREMFDRNVAYLNFCFSEKGYCSDEFDEDWVEGGPGWTQWLPASNEGRMLAGAAGTLRWRERADMRAVVDRIMQDIADRMRKDGYFDYYPESDSYTRGYDDLNSERKNYDRVFWTRGVLAAGLVGDPRAYPAARRMYDWFNSSSHLPTMLEGGNSTNGLPGGPLMHLSPVGKADDLVVTQRFYDQEFWMTELANREPLSFTYYPGDRPHCYDLLGLEAFIDEYRATGEQKYIDAVDGGWQAYRESFLHVGGATGLCELGGPYPPGSLYITTGHTGETCGSVFWININGKLLNLRPDEEKYAGEIEQALLNVIAAAQDDRGFLRYHARLHGTKEAAKCSSTCCEVSTAGLIGRMPELLYSVDDAGVFVNLYTNSAFTWTDGGRQVSLTVTADVPAGPDVSVTVATPRDEVFALRLRIPSWMAHEVQVQVNGVEHGNGRPGTYFCVEREWADGDVVTFALPAAFSVVEYTGLDQVEGGAGRYGLLYGPLLMALRAPAEEDGSVPRIPVAPEELPARLVRSAAVDLEFEVEGHPGYRYVPYSAIGSETFTCYPVLDGSPAG
jgi:hypothetical protein